MSRRKITGLVLLATPFVGLLAMIAAALGLPGALVFIGIFAAMACIIIGVILVGP